jgi:DNA primase large subunit
LANLEEEALRFFPPCMSNSLKGLRTHHRLCHQPRVQLTLFLKSIGLRVDDCLRLLQEEYSKPACQGQAHKCAHSWQKDSSRYIYGTRHLYGLEGSRKNYSSHSCGSIQV